MKHLYITCVHLLFLVGCNEQQNRNKIAVSNTIHIVDINHPIKVSLSDFITDIDTIRLEAADNSLLKNIVQLQVLEDRIYILTSNWDALFIFDINGKFIAQIFDKGQGPNDYIRINCFWVDPFDDRIIIPDGFSRKILIYDKNGKQLDVIKLNFPPMLIIPYNDGYINNSSGYGYNQSPDMADYHINFLNSNGEFIKSALREENKMGVPIFSFGRVNILKDGDILFQPPLSYIVYKIHDNEAIPYYEFNNLSKFKSLSDKEYRNFDYRFGENNLLKEKEDQGYLLTWGDVYDTDSFVIFLFRGYDICRLLYYDKKNLKSFFVDPLSLIGDNYSIDFFMNYISAVYNDRLYAAPSDYILLKLKGEVKINDNKVQEFLNNTDEDSNPFIISFKLKFPE